MSEALPYLHPTKVFIWKHININPKLLVDMPVKKKELLVYVASPYGFAEATRGFMNKTLHPLIRDSGGTVLDPWTLTPGAAKSIALIQKSDSISFQRMQLSQINLRIGSNNAQAIIKSDLILAVLDGPDIDSGVCAELGFGYGVGKQIHGYRGDFRLTGENLGCKVNMQVEYFIAASGGKISDSLKELGEVLRKVAAERKA